MGTENIIIKREIKTDEIFDLNFKRIFATLIPANMPEIRRKYCINWIVFAATPFCKNRSGSKNDIVIINNKIMLK